MRKLTEQQLPIVTGGYLQDQDPFLPEDPVGLIRQYLHEVGFDRFVLEVGATGDPNTGYTGVQSAEQAERCANTILAWSGLGSLLGSWNFVATLIGFVVGGGLAAEYSRACNP